MFSFAKHFLFCLTKIYKIDWIGSKLTPDLGESSADTQVNREKNTPEPGGVAATCRKVLFSLTLTPWMARPFSPFHAGVTLPSPGGSPFIPNLCDEHMSLRAHPHRVSHSLQHILSGLRWTDKEFWQERELFCLKGRETWWWDISGSLGALLASCAALLSAPVGNWGIFKGNPELQLGWNTLGSKI